MLCPLRGSQPSLARQGLASNAQGLSARFRDEHDRSSGYFDTIHPQRHAFRFGIYHATQHVWRRIDGPWREHTHPLRKTERVLGGRQTELNGDITDDTVIEDDTFNGIALMTNPGVHAQRFFVEGEFFGGRQQQRFSAFFVVDAV